MTVAVSLLFLQELQRLGQAAIASEVGMQHIQQQLQQLKAANQQLLTRFEVRVLAWFARGSKGA
jgi:hypothetical protein